MTKEQQSYDAHSKWYEKRFPDKDLQNETIRRWLDDKRSGNINYWIHKRMFGLADPLCSDLSKTWLTVGDGYGIDANYFFEKGLDVTASDISGTFLPLAREHNLLEKYMIENVEKLSFDDNCFDYVFCKESYHHFPRPYMAVYEMLRVARHGVVLIEPQDPISKIPLLLAFRNMMDRIDTSLLRRVWKNQYSFEEVGNYVFKLSVREMEKLSNGIGMPAMAVKGINNNFYTPEVHNQKADNSSAVFRKIQRKRLLLDLLSDLSIIPRQVLGIIIFKTMPGAVLRERLIEDGYKLYCFPDNPYTGLP